jgi:HEAT repeat protein
VVQGDVTIDERAQRYAAERLVAGVEAAVRGWDRDPRQAAAHLDVLLRMASPRGVMFLEGAYRSRRRSLTAIVATDVAALDEGYGRYATAVAALLTFDRSGYLREAGVQRLASCDEPFVLPFLLLRLNDPVDPVRERAVAAVGHRLGTGHAALLVQLLPLIEGLGARRRASPIVRTVSEILVAGDPAGRDALWAGARGDDAAVRASCLRMLATIEPSAAVEHAIGTGDPALRHWAAAVATAPRLDADVQRRLLPLLESDPHPHIRWRALRARTRHPGNEPHLRRALLDPDARVRYLARVGLRALGHTDTVELYRATLADRTATAGAILGALAGLADMGTRDDSPRIIRFLDHPNARLRGEAWRALAAVDPDGFNSRTDQLRADPSGKVRRHLPRAGRNDERWAGPVR